MTPAAQTVYIDLATGALRAAASGTAAPEIALILLAGGQLNFAFLNAGTVVELDADSTGQFSLFGVDDANGDVLFLDTSMEKTGSGAEARYHFAGLIDSAALRAALGGVKSKQFTAQVQFTQPTDGEASSSQPFDLTIWNNQNRPEIAAPAASSEFSFVLNAEGDAAEFFVNGTSKGFVLLTTDPHP